MTTDGPWEIEERVAWHRVDARVIVLLLTPPYQLLPWRLTEPAASVWECVTEGATLPEIAAEVGATDIPERLQDVRDFVAELLSAGLIRPRQPAARA